MLLHDKNRFKEFLHEASQRFANHASMPGELSPLCDFLDVEVVRSPDVGSGRALLIKEKCGYQIKLPQIKTKGDAYTLFEEFLIAHEIGHLLLEQKYSVRPTRTKEYWEFEKLCDYFARMLLLPENYISEKLRGLKAEPSTLLELSNQISKDMQVYWPVAAHRLAEIFPDFAIFRATKGEGSSRGKHFKINMTTLENRKELGRKFWLENEIGRKFEAMTNNGDRIFLEQSIFKYPDVVKTFPTFYKGKEGYAYRQNNRDLRFIIKFSE